MAGVLRLVEVFLQLFDSVVSAKTRSAPELLPRRGVLFFLLFVFNRSVRPSRLSSGRRSSLLTMMN